MCSLLSRPQCHEYTDTTLRDARFTFLYMDVESVVANVDSHDHNTTDVSFTVPASSFVQMDVKSVVA